MRWARCCTSRRGSEGGTLGYNDASEYPKAHTAISGAGPVVVSERAVKVSWAAASGQSMSLESADGSETYLVIGSNRMCPQGFYAEKGLRLVGGGGALSGVVFWWKP